MKTRIYLLAAFGLSVLLLFVNCGGEDPKPDPITITANPITVTIPATGGEQLVTVAANADWTAASNQTWLTVTVLGAGSLRVSAEINTTGNDRTATVSLTAGTAKASVSVAQAKLTAMQADSLALVALYSATNGANWTAKWNLSTPVKQWHGVTVANNRVTELKLAGNNLNGALPADFANLGELQYVDVCKNNLSGAFPAAINNLTKLTYLDLSENQFTGTIPALGNLTKLILFDVSVNAFTGSLPTSLSSAVALEYLAFHKNTMNGTLPTTWKALVKLNYLDLSGNSFTGTVPSDWASMAKMQAFYLYKNSLDGNIPAYLSTFTNLKSLALDGNNFTGAIPNTLGDLATLDELWLAQNRLTGDIPNSLLNNVHWNGWQDEVCPQQAGYGFGNCSGSPAPPTAQKHSTHRLYMKERYKR